MYESKAESDKDFKKMMRPKKSQMFNASRFTGKRRKKNPYENESGGPTKYRESRLKELIKR